VSASTAAKDLRTIKGKEQVQALIKRVSEKLKEKGITTALFDRGAYRFHGIVRCIADTIREQGIRI
jgi:large subunit ribosomal protein L18